LNKTDISVDQLVGMIARGELRLPEMQRRGGNSGDIINDYENRSGRRSISCVSGENPEPVAVWGRGNWRLMIGE
jgi:hypothetical protein